MREVKTFGVILYLVQSIKQGPLPLTTTGGYIEQEESELSLSMGQKKKKLNNVTVVKSSY